MGRPAHRSALEVLAKPRSTVLLLAISLSTLSLGCEGDRQAEAPSPERGDDQAPGAHAPAREGEPAPQAEAEDVERYTLQIDAPVEVAQGKEAMAKVTVHPVSPWHMNLDFPVSLELESVDGVAFVLQRQRKSDAERLDDDGLVFAVPFTVHARGDKRIEGKIKFAVCGEQACDPVSLPVMINVRAA